MEGTKKSSTSQMRKTEVNNDTKCNGLQPPKPRYNKLKFFCVYTGHTIALRRTPVDTEQNARRPGSIEMWHTVLVGEREAARLIYLQRNLNELIYLL